MDFRRRPSLGTHMPIVHLELHTPDLPAARAFYAELFGWRSERVETDHGSYVALGPGGEVGGGIVECGVARALWLPYVEVDRIAEATERARSLGGAAVLGPREGPAGWRSVISTEAGGQIALWQPKGPR
jgi:predicted enzyme related to lactoylglutathione lyase